MGKNAKLLHAARAEARRHAELNPPPEADAAEALNWILAHLMDEARYLAQKVGELREDEVEVMTAFGPVPHQYIRAFADVRKELASLCINMERVGLAERMVRIQEARALLIVQALTEAAAEAGIPRAKLKQIGPAFRRRLEAIESGAPEREPQRRAVA